MPRSFSCSALHTLGLATLLAGSAAGCVATRPIELNAGPRVAAENSKRRAPREAVRWYNDFWRAISDDNVKAAWVLADTRDQRRFADVLDAWFGGDVPAARSAVLPLLASDDSTVRAAARLTYSAILSSQGEWGELASFADTAPHDARDAAGVESWAPAFRTIVRRITFSDSIARIPITRSASGVVTIPITINGVTRHFWLDTGSSITIISSDVATACGLDGAGHDTLELLTSVGRLPARPAVARDLRVGNAHFEAVPTMIVESGSLRMRSEGKPTDERIDGVLGFDIIRTLDVTIDDGRGEVIVRRPILQPSSKERPRNLAWFGVPVVTLVSERGAPLHLALDTGAGETFGTPALVTKTGARWSPAERRVGGFGASSVERGLVIPSVRVFVGDVPLVLERIFLYEARYPTIFTLDGTLGAEVGRGGTLRIDMTNGRIEVRSR